VQTARHYWSTYLNCFISVADNFAQLCWNTAEDRKESKEKVVFLGSFASLGCFWSQSNNLGSGRCSRPSTKWANSFVCATSSDSCAGSIRTHFTPIKTQSNSVAGWKTSHSMGSGWFRFVPWSLKALQSCCLCWRRSWSRSVPTCSCADAWAGRLTAWSCRSLRSATCVIQIAVRRRGFTANCCLALTATSVETVSDLTAPASPNSAAITVDVRRSASLGWYSTLAFLL